LILLKSIMLHSRLFHTVTILSLKKCLRTFRREKFKNSLFVNNTTGLSPILHCLLWWQRNFTLTTVNIMKTGALVTFKNISSRTQTVLHHQLKQSMSNTSELLITDKTQALKSPTLLSCVTFASGVDSWGHVCLAHYAAPIRDPCHAPQAHRQKADAATAGENWSARCRRQPLKRGAPPPTKSDRLGSLAIIWPKVR